MSVKKSCMIFSIILLLIIYIIFIINTCMCIFFLLKCQTVLMHFNRCTYYTSYMQLHTCIYFKVFLIHLDMRKKILQVIIDQSYYYSLWYLILLVVIPSYFKIIGNDRSMEFILSTDHIWTHLVLFAHSVAYGFSLTCIMPYLAKKSFICSVQQNQHLHIAIHICTEGKIG